ncbi:MAG TPA: ABC transporter permease [Alphaproteobacteria bacterium]|nr:ABC transporter permease [Alphaproteobacteria bacterium]
MRQLRAWFLRLLGAFTKRERDDELAAEFESHLQMHVDDNLRAGMSEEEARRDALLQLGGESVKESYRASAGLPWLETLLQDVRFGARMLRKNPGFTAVAVFALALGIGVNTAVFTAYKAMIARPLNARNPDEMVNVALVRSSGATDFTFSYPDYEAYRDSARSFRGLIAFSPERMALSNAGGIVSQRAAAAGSQLGKLGLISSGGNNAEFASVHVVSENFFKVLGVAALRGRTFDSITIPDLMASPPVLISENYWQRRFAGDPAMLGRIIHLNGAAVTIIGITPHDFVGTGVAVPDFWVPLSLEPFVHADDKLLRDRENQRYRLFARLASGVSIGQAQAEITLIADHLRTLHDPHSDAAKPSNALIWPGSPFPLPLNQYKGLNLTILLIMVAAGMVLAVACANVSSLQLVRARSRQDELRTRLSLGASRVRLIRQLLTESSLLGLSAGVVALLFSWVLLHISVTLVADAVPIEYGTLIFNVTPDLKIFTYVFAISLVTGILFGLAPAIESSRSSLSSSKASGATVRSRRLQSFFITAQVALSLVLMIAGSMLIRSSIHALKTDPGYESKHVVDFNFQFPEASKYTAEHKDVLTRELRTRLAALPGVAAITSATPPDGSLLQTAAISLNDEKSPAQPVQSFVYYIYVEANYFQTLSIPLLQGRGFQAQAGQPESAVILSESAAQQLWPGRNPIGQSLRLGITDEKPHNPRDLFADGPAYQVIGVARDTRGVQFDGSGSKTVYLPLPDHRLSGRPILVRTESDPAQVIRMADPVTASVDPDLVVSSSTLEEDLLKTGPFIVSSLAAGIASTVGLLGLLLAAMGIYGTTSYIVVLRTREVGIRMAVGAQKRHIFGLIMMESTRPVLAGLFVGIFLSAGVSYLLRGVFYGLNTVDSISFAGVSLLFLAIAVLATYPPSRRAMRVDPVIALRYE